MTTNWDKLRPVLFESIGTTIYMVLITLVVGGLIGLVVGTLLYATRKGGILQNTVAHTVLNVLVNIVRPIPFIILLGIVDMSAMAGTIGGGGLGDFALVYGYQRFDWQVTLVATLVIILLVQASQFFGNWEARKALRR